MEAPGLRGRVTDRNFLPTGNASFILELKLVVESKNSSFWLSTSQGGFLSGIQVDCSYPI